MTTLDVPTDILDLLDWRRRVHAVYAEIRSAPDPIHAWKRWREVRDELFASHPQSPLGTEARGGFGGLDYYDYDPHWRMRAMVSATAPAHHEIDASDGSTISFSRFGTVTFETGDGSTTLELYWLAGYGGGLFLPFRDATAGRETYGAGRYLLDTVKGADLGMQDGDLILDFNFSYNPSCSYDPRWACPLAPPANRLDIAITAGEKHAPAAGDPMKDLDAAGT